MIPLKRLCEKPIRRRWVTTKSRTEFWGTLRSEHLVCQHRYSRGNREVSPDHDVDTVGMFCRNRRGKGLKTFPWDAELASWMWRSLHVHSDKLICSWSRFRAIDEINSQEKLVFDDRTLQNQSSFLRLLCRTGDTVRFISHHGTWTTRRFSPGFGTVEK